MSGNNPFLAQIQRAQELRDEEKLYRYNGVLYPTIMCPEEHLKALESVEAREDDVVLVAYPKCGFNWMTGVLQKIISAATGREVESQLPPLIEFFGPEMLQVIHQNPSPRLLGTHMHPDNIPLSFFTKKTKMLVIFRNPKDTVVSYYHFSNKIPVIPSPQSWDSFYSQFMSGDVPWGSYFDHALGWEKRMDDPNIMIITYEELKQDLPGGVRRISQFFGFSLTEDHIQNISQQSTFTAMKQNSSMIGEVIYRKGEIGDWRSHFSTEQSHQMDLAFEKHLAKTRLGAQLKYHLHCLL